MTSATSETIDADRYLNDSEELRRSVGIPEGAQVELRRIGAGEHNINYLLCFPAHEQSAGEATSLLDEDPGREREERRFVLRINVIPQPFHDNQVAYEFNALRYLERSGRTPKPIYLDDSPAAPANGAMIISFCPGSELDFDDLRPGDLARAAKLMADVHAVPVDASCPVHRPDDPLRELFDECLARFDAYLASGFEDKRITRWAQRFISAAQAFLTVPCAPGDRSHVINTEPLPSHFLLPRGDRQGPSQGAIQASPPGPSQGAIQASPPGPSQGAREELWEESPDEGSKITGDACPLASQGLGGQGDYQGAFIDWERPIVGEVAQHIAYFTAPTTTFWDSDFVMTSEQAQRFVESYWDIVDGRFERGGFDERFAAYRAMTALRSVTWCCKALPRYAEALGRGKGSCDPSAHRTDKTAVKLPIYLSDDFMEMLFEEVFRR